MIFLLYFQKMFTYFVYIVKTGKFSTFDHPELPPEAYFAINRFCAQVSATYNWALVRVHEAGLGAEA
jgi:hypothetical protein